MTISGLCLVEVLVGLLDHPSFISKALLDGFHDKSRANLVPRSFIEFGSYAIKIHSPKSVPPKKNFSLFQNSNKNPQLFKSEKIKKLKQSILTV
jgi:hypothetical protein